MEVKVGDILVFKGGGFMYEVLSRILKLFDPSWDRWGWHTGFVTKVYENLIETCEALGAGVHIVAYQPTYFTPIKVRVYRWLPNEPSQEQINIFLGKHLNEKYDILVYPLTAIAYIARHYWGRPIPRLFDNRWSCWELTYYFADDMGRAIAEDYDFPMINEMVKKLAPTQVKYAN